jgi:hypothetical protein
LEARSAALETLEARSAALETLEARSVEAAAQQTHLQQLDDAAVRQVSSWKGSGNFPQLLPVDQSRPLTAPSGGRKGSFFSEDLANNNNNNNSMSKEADRLVLSVLEETGKPFIKSHKLVQFLSLESAVFGTPRSASGSVSQKYGSGSSSGSFHHQAKIVRKTLFSTVL